MVIDEEVFNLVLMKDLFVENGISVSKSKTKT